MTQFPKQNLNTIHQELKNKGFSKVQCAAILGCWMQESSLNPHAQEGPPPKGLGLAQWSFERRKLVPQPFTDVATDIHKQVDLFVRELNGTHKHAGDILRSAQDLDQAMKGMQKYELFGIEGKRRQYADELLNILDGSSVPDGTLQLGSRGPDVSELQKKLTAKGFSPGAIDGDFGNNTKKAVIDFQHSVGITADGIVGPLTRKALGL